jgi:heat shock protein HslJ
MAGETKALGYLVALALVVATGCASGDSGSGSAGETGPAPHPAASAQPVEPALLAHRWQLQALGEIGAEEPVPSVPPITLSFADDHGVSGSGGCNHFSTAARFGAEHELGLGALAATKKACEAETMDREEEFFTALGSVTSYEVGEDQLLLFYDESRDSMMFGVAADPGPDGVDFNAPGTSGTSSEPRPESS